MNTTPDHDHDFAYPVLSMAPYRGWVDCCRCGTVRTEDGTQDHNPAFVKKMIRQTALRNASEIIGN